MLTLCVGRFLSFAAMLLPSTAASPESEKFDPAEFSRIDNEQRVTFVLAVLQQREAGLSNFAYKLSSVETNVWRDGARKTMQTDSVEIRRNADKLWLSGRCTYSTGNVSPVEAKANWDGHISKSFAVHTATKLPPTGSIRDKEHPMFEHTGYNHILGIRYLQRFGGPPKSVARWLARARELKRPIEVSAVEDNRRALVRVKVSVPQAFVYEIFELDPGRGYMPIRYEYLYQLKSSYNSDSMLVQEARQIDGFWIPTKVLRRVGTSASPDHETETIYQVESFSLGATKDEDLVLDFPVGARVVDAVTRKAFRVLSNGESEPMPYLDGATGEIVSAQGERTPATLAIANASTQPAPVQQVSSVVPPSSSRWPPILAITTGALCIGVAVKTLFFRRPQTADRSEPGKT
jgi:hypothetical protein